MPYESKYWKNKYIYLCIYLFIFTLQVCILIWVHTTALLKHNITVLQYEMQKNSEYTHRFIDLLTHFPHQLHIWLLPSHQHDSMFISDTHTHTRLHVASANPVWFLCRWQSFLFQCAFNMISLGFCIKLRREKKIQHSYLRSWTGAVFDPVATISCNWLCFSASLSLSA